MEYNLTINPEYLHEILYDLKYNGYIKYTELDTINIHTSEDIPEYMEEFLKAILCNSNINIIKDQPRIYVFSWMKSDNHVLRSEWPSETDLYFSKNYLHVTDSNVNNYIENQYWQGNFYYEESTLGKFKFTKINLW